MFMRYSKFIFYCYSVVIFPDRGDLITAVMSSFRRLRMAFLVLGASGCFKFDLTTTGLVDDYSLDEVNGCYL